VSQLNPLSESSDMMRKIHVRTRCGLKSILPTAKPRI